jgi:hypothetical protein
MPPAKEGPDEAVCSHGRVARRRSRDLTLPENVRIYLLSGTQHAESAFPPTRTVGAQLNNPTPQANVMRALLRAVHQWAAEGTAPPPSQIPRLADRTLVAIKDNTFPSIPTVSDPHQMIGPARVTGGKVTPLPYLVPQVDADGNDLAGIRVPELAVPLATATGWNFRAPKVGNPGDLYQLLGSYVPFTKTRAERTAQGDTRLSIEERYKDRDDYLARVRAEAVKLIKGRYLLQEDLDDVMARATRHWNFAIAAPQPTPEK